MCLVPSTRTLPWVAFPDLLNLIVERFRKEKKHGLLPPKSPKKTKQVKRAGEVLHTAPSRQPGACVARCCAASCAPWPRCRRAATARRTRSWPRSCSSLAWRTEMRPWPPGPGRDRLGGWGGPGDGETTTFGPQGRGCVRFFFWSGGWDFFGWVGSGRGGKDNVCTYFAGGISSLEGFLVVQDFVHPRNKI